jgi:hypothetical protein
MLTLGRQAQTFALGEIVKSRYKPARTFFYGLEHPVQIISLLISPFFCEQLLHTFLLQMLQVPLWPEHAGDLHISHLML